MNAANIFFGLPYSALELDKYITIGGEFTLFLTDGRIIKFTPEHEPDFQHWLDENHIQNIRKEEGWIVE